MSCLVLLLLLLHSYILFSAQQQPESLHPLSAQNICYLPVSLKVKVKILTQAASCFLDTLFLPSLSLSLSQL